MSTAALVRILVILAIIALGVGYAIAVMALINRISGALMIMAEAVFLAYALAPVVALLKKRVPLAVSVGLTYLALLAIVALFFFIIVPPLTAEVQQFVSTLPALPSEFHKALEQTHFLARLPTGIATKVFALPDQIGTLLEYHMPTIATQGFNLLLSLASVTLSLVIVPLLAAYLIFDADELRRAFLGFIPETKRPGVIAILSDLDTVLGGFIRGQILDALIVGAMIGIMLAFNHVPYAVLIGILAGALNFIPYCSIVTIVPSALFALIYNGWQDALIVMALFAVIQQIDGNVVEPLVMRQNVSLPPAILITSIVALSALFGILGAFIAVPTAAMLRVIKLHLAPAPTSEELIYAERQAKRKRRL